MAECDLIRALRDSIHGIRRQERRSVEKASPNLLASPSDSRRLGGQTVSSGGIRCRKTRSIDRTIGRAATAEDTFPVPRVYSQAQAGLPADLLGCGLGCPFVKCLRIFARGLTRVEGCVWGRVALFL